jgi:soluble lytic murein transglycosylase-like protein
VIKLPRIARPIPFFLASFGLTLAVLASVQGTRSVPLPPVEEAIQFASLETAPYSKAAAAFRAGDFPAAQTELEHLANTGSLQAHVILGLYAHSTDRDALALEQLRAAEDYRGEFADWRLWALAESAETLGQSPLSLAVLWRLVEEHPDSPLRSRAVEILASRAAAQSDWLEALTISQNLYGPRLDSQARERLARIAWQASKELDDLEVQQAAARRLLVDHPLMAPELDVVELFREPEGGVPWPEFLSVRELVRRSESLLNADLQDSALETLAEVPESARGIDWHLIQARSLTAAHRGNEALSALESAVSPVPTRANQIEWERARAALEYSTPRRGRGEVTAEQRGEMRQRAHQHLRNVVEGSDEDLAVRALKLLFADLMEDERFDEAISILNRLKGFNPRDTTGARTLWGHGWKEFSERNYSGAVGYWTELGQLYPQSNYNRSGLYWSARSHEKLGNPGRAQELLHQVADVDFTDFYRRHALTRLETKAGVRDTDQEQPTEPWPVDPALARAESLYQLGLDDAALLELEATLESAGHRAAQALKARILAASGSRRQSILALRQAFPILGTPHQGLAPSEARRLYYPLDFQDVIEEHSKSRHLPSHLIFGMIRQESAFDASAKSWAGAQGLMQIMPATGRELARRLGLHYSRERLSDPEFSIQLGTLYFQQVLNMFSGDEVLALAGYNAGPYRIKRLWRQAGTDAEIDQFLEQLSYSETRNYVKRVLLYSDSYRRLYDSSG